MHIRKISNGYLVSTEHGYPIYTETSVYLKDMKSVIKFLESTYGAVENEVDKIRSEKDS